MTVALSILAVAFAAFCVWLTVRTVSRRERWAKWTLAAAVALPVVYLVSIGPATFLVLAAGEPDWAESTYTVVYAPFWWVRDNLPEPARHCVYAYTEWWMNATLAWLPITAHGN